MKLRPKITLIDHFTNLTDPRIDRTKEHKLIDIVTIAICAVICGADTWVGMEAYGLAKYKWLKEAGVERHSAGGRLDGDLNPHLTEDRQIRDFGGGLKPDWARQKGFIFN